MSQALNVRHTAVDSTARTNAQSSAQVKRYWPGRAPDWVDKDKPEDADSDEEEEEADVKEEDDGGEDPAVTAIAAPVVLKKVADPRLARLSVKEEDTGVARPKVISRRQARGDSDEGSDESASESEEESEEEDEAVTARRAAVRERLKRRQVDQEEELLGAPGSEGEGEESESEYETDSEEEEFGRRMLKPVFVTKKERETIAEREALEREEEEAMKKEKARLKERAKQTKEMVIEQLQAEEAAAQAAREGPKEQGDIDTDDEQYAEQEYVQWKNREYARIRREREEREAQAEAEAEKERIRNMTPSERAAWERDNPRVLHQAPKKSWKFMQKYWHKGAFFQEVSDNPHAAGSQPDDIYVRDYSAPTGEDKLNKEMLPKVMQVKNFGRRGQTKYTHLVDQDTTVRDDYYNQDTKPKKGRRQAGTDQVFEKPKKFLT